MKEGENGEKLSIKAAVKKLKIMAQVTVIVKIMKQKIESRVVIST